MDGRYRDEFTDEMRRMREEWNKNKSNKSRQHEVEHEIRTKTTKVDECASHCGPPLDVPSSSSSSSSSSCADHPLAVRPSDTVIHPSPLEYYGTIRAITYVRTQQALQRQAAKEMAKRNEDARTNDVRVVQ